MLSSLQTGIRETAEEEDASWALVAPVDQPFLSPGLIGRLQARARRARDPQPPLAVAPATPEMERAGVWGLPVLLSRCLFPEILAMSRANDASESGDRGAARLLGTHSRRLAIIPARPQELLDVDDQEEYRRAQNT